MSELLQRQMRFMRAIGNFISAVNLIHPDVEMTAGDFWATADHMIGSMHYARLAADINIFYQGDWLETYEQAPDIWDSLGRIWKAQHEHARWGGDFEEKDLNHFSFTYNGYS